VIVAGLVYISNQLPLNRGGTVILEASVAVTSAPFSTPVEPFAQVDPAILPYLEYGQPQYGVVPMDVVGANVPPVGAYLPRAGNTQSELPAPTTIPVPTSVPQVDSATATPPPLPYPTSPPVPTQVITPTLDLVATVIAFDNSLVPVQFNRSCGPSGVPVEKLLTQRFHAYHSGIDLSAALGTPVLATHSAIVTWADWNTFGYGNLVILQSDRYITYYAHLTSFNVAVGQYIQRGAIIGFSGSTGNSSGPHVHYETRIDDIPVDPLSFEERGLGTC
jgi:murein DD-endopeptidase MepM/ murein hydrolase activator NlpD